MSDQHNPAVLGIAGDPVARTPFLDEFARSAVRFESAYCADPFCVPSRASLLTGLHVHNHKTYNNGMKWRFDKKSIAHYFAQAGYMTALVGKMHFVDAQRHGFDYNLDFNEWFQYLGPKTKIFADEEGVGNSGYGLPQVEDLWGKNEMDDPWKGVRTPDGRRGTCHPGRVSVMAEEDHFESFVARESVRFLQEHGKEQPFLLISSLLKPHNPWMPAERFAKMFPAESMKVPDTWGKVDRSKVPAYIRWHLAHPLFGSCPELSDPEGVKVHNASYYACVTQMDDRMGRVLRTLRELDLEKDTIVVYTSDHGDMLGEHGLWAKPFFYDPSVGVPLICRVPGLTPANVRSRTPVSLVQLVPTLLDLCGLPIPSGLDGESFAADLRDPTRTRDTTVFAEDNLGSSKAIYMMRRGNYKYIHYLNDIPELYNLRQDPKEMTNLAMQPEFQGKLGEMKAQLFAWHQPSEAEAPDGAKPG